MKVNLVINHKAITIRFENHVNINMVLELVEILPLQLSNLLEDVEFNLP
jgi:hypothetical protein